MTNSGLLVKADTLAITGDFSMVFRKNSKKPWCYLDIPSAVSHTHIFIHKQILLNLF